MDYYAQNRKGSSVGSCPHFVEVVINNLSTDAQGNLVSLASYLDEEDTRQPMTLDEIKDVVRKNIRQAVVDLIKISEI